MIESVNNERVKYWTKLSEKKYQDAENLFLVEGEHLVIEAEKAGMLKEVIVLNGYDYDFENKTFVSESVMRKISTLKNIPKVVGVAAKIKDGDLSGNVILLDGVQDPGNLGTIIRSAVAFNLGTLVLGENTVSLYNPKVIRATEGLIFHLNIVTKPLKETINELKKLGYTVYSTDVTSGISLKDISFKDKTAIIMGSEGSGVRKEIKDLCDEFINIEMNKTCESLNVGVATSIILYELNNR